MRFFMRCGRVLILLALLMTPLMAHAQDEAITVAGSGIVQPLVQALADASGADPDLTMTVTGTRSGFNQFCAGQADMTTANRRIAAEEGTNCTANNVTYLELLLGQEINAFIASPAADFLTCLSGAQLNQIFGLSAEGQTTNWNQVLPDAPDTPLSVFVPSDSTASYAILDKVIEGDGIRADATMVASAREIIQAVTANPGALGVVRLSDAQAANDAVKILDVNAGQIDACQSPTSENVEDGLYPAADQLFLYVNVGSLNKPGLAETLDFAVSSEAASTVAAQGISAPTANALQKNSEALQAARTGEPIIQTTGEFVAPVGVAGTVTVGGAANGFNFIRSASSAFTANNASITINTDVKGEPAGFRRLCNDELDIAIAYRDMTDQEMANCSANNLTTFPIELGREAVVLVANAESDYLTCLKTDQLAAAWDSRSASTITTWKQVSGDFPDTPMTLFAPPAGNPLTDLLLLASEGKDPASRIDTQTNADPLYRAAATANVEGALTYMSWAEYQAVLDKGQANIQLVAVARESDCVMPSLETIADGSYPLTRRALLLVNQDSLVKPQVQAFLWYLLSNENYPSLEANGFVGVRFGDLAGVRTALQEAFSAAEIRALERASAAAATPEATVEATPES